MGRFGSSGTVGDRREASLEVVGAESQQEVVVGTDFLRTVVGLRTGPPNLRAVGGSLGMMSSLRYSEGFPTMVGSL